MKAIQTQIILGFINKDTGSCIWGNSYPGIDILFRFLTNEGQMIDIVVNSYGDAFISAYIESEVPSTIYHTD